jgi:hypothetical protein
MKDDPNSLARRNALKRIGATAVTGLSLALHPSSEGGRPKESGVQAEQPAKKDEKSVKKTDTSKKKPIAEFLPREKANLLTSTAKNLTREDLLALGKGERTAATGSLTVKDLGSLTTVFGTARSNHAQGPQPHPGCCCCCPPACCCCCQEYR